MPTLTPEMIEAFPYSHYADQQTMKTGRKKFESGDAFEIAYYDDWASVVVDDDNEVFDVEISCKERGQLGFSCGCPHARRGYLCVHMIAATLALSEYLRGEKKSHWQGVLGRALEESTTQRKSNAHRYAAVFVLNLSEYYGSYSVDLSPYMVKASFWPLLQEARDASPDDVNTLLRDHVHEWKKFAENPYRSVNPAGCMNLLPEGRAFFNFLIQQTSYSGYFKNFSVYLPFLASMKAPLFLTRSRGGPLEPLDLLNEPVEVQAALTRDGDILSLQAGLYQNGQVFSSAKSNLKLITNDPPWVLLGNTLAPISNPESLALVEILPLEIPADEENIFREQYFRQIAERIQLQGDVVEWETVTADAIPRLYLRDEKNILLADLRFGYGEHELPAQPQPEERSVLDVPGEWTMVRIDRQPEKETESYGLLTDARYGLKRAGKEQPYGTFELRARTHPLDFLMHSIPALTKAGFEIYGEEKLKAGKINRSEPKISLNITSGIDWFDLKAVVSYGDQQVALRDMRRALKKGERYIKLADGSIGQIPETWLEKYKHLFEMAEETDEGLRLSDFHLPLVDELLDDAEQVQTPPDLPARRERLRSFEQILPQSLPEGFTGELRPYQKAGFDWLHFLREYKFGGILADDMGLGKTIQVLAYLQSLKEKGSGAVSLLVVPKSLLTNWQREAEKFTPSLRFLEYMGNAREKDTTIFADYDIILTTYGTMLRDIELLRSYRFHYVVLDESQAIKNPLSQSAKAARLLDADHRLCMTGTPVENNTFELWSQFAFLNPGLLGGLDHFKKNFASPIESSGDEATAQLLRKLVYPFILRRTKEQVAPELPPRTERVLYTDMEPHQRKLYAQTRERYRAELLGLIDSDGLDDARMKILEGLLRLRQIAIHPALVEPTYHGEAPKFELLFETLETLQAEKHKALVFSQFIETLSMARKELEKRGIPYVYLDGKTRDRQDQVDRFQEDPAIPFFLISLKAGGVGLNLTAADYVIHLDPWWNPAVEMQASDRAHRIGQDKPVFVYKIIARDTVEEKILQLQERKKALVESLISTESSFFKSLTREDVQALFS